MTTTAYDDWKCTDPDLEAEVDEDQVDGEPDYEAMVADRAAWLTS